MEEDPTKGDWRQLVKEDLVSIDMSIEDEEKNEMMTEKNQTDRKRKNTTSCL